MIDARERGVSLEGGDVGERMAERRERLGIGAQRHPDGPLPHRQPNAPRQRAVPVRGGEHETVIPPSDVRDSCGSQPPVQASPRSARSEEHTSELQSLMRISYAVFCLKKKKNKQNKTTKIHKTQG